MMQLSPALDRGAQATTIQRRYRRNRWRWRRTRKAFRAQLVETDARLFPGIERIIEGLIPTCMMMAMQQQTGAHSMQSSQSATTILGS